MQTTLLGLAITFIVALVAALIGPHFIDWNRFRPQFEAEAARVIGAPVRVEGAFDARLLPSPSLRLHSVVVGGPNDPGKVRADNLEVEFSLSSLMRGEWRATELTINGVSLDLGLDARGRIDWPLSSRSLNIGSLSIDRLNLTGRVALHDAASRTTVELSDIAFSGDVRSLGASVRGDGNFVLSGTRYPFRISSGQADDGRANRVHVTVDPGGRALSVDLDGNLIFDSRVPHFEGVVAIAGPVASGNRSSSADEKRPWRMSAKVKADPNAARLEQIEASYGGSDAALKLAGVGDIRFGASPQIRAVLSARRLDADRLLAKDNQDAPIQPLSVLRDLLTKIPESPFAASIEVNVEQITMGGRPLQNFGAGLHSDAAAWTIDRLEFQAPGAAQVSLNGRIQQPGPAAKFSGALNLESSDPGTFVAWLQGRSDITYRSQKPLRLRSDLRVDSEQVAFDQVKADIEGDHVEGRLAFIGAADGKGVRTEAELRAGHLDLDAAAALTRAVVGPQGAWPEEGSFSLNIDRAISSGQELRPFAAKLTYGPKTVSLQQLKIGQPGGLTLEGAGTFDRVNTTGKISLDTTANSVAQITSLIAPVAPAVAARLKATLDTSGAARLKLALDIDKGSAKDKADARAKLEIDLPQVKGTVSLAAAPSLASVRSVDLDALGRSEVTLQAKLSAERGDALLALLGLDRIVAVRKGPLLFEGTATGNWRAPMRLNVRMSGSDLDADIKGTLEPWPSERKADLRLAVRRANVSPLLDLKPSDPRAENISLTSRVTLAGSKLTFSDLDSTVVGARVRGRVAVNMGDENAVEGEIGMDSLDLASAFGLAVGAAGRDTTEPLGRGLLAGWRGQLTFEALRGTLPGGIEFQPISGVVKGDGQSLTFDATKGKIGDGDATVRINARQTADGVALNAEAKVTGADGPALHYGSLTMPAGRVSAQMTLASVGRSASALVGALSGSGLVTLAGARIAGLDPRMFNVVLDASDGGRVPDDNRLRQLVEQSLSANPLPVASAQIPFNIRDGRLRVGATPLEGEGAQAIVSGGYDIAADQVDIRASLASTSAGSVNNRPEVQIFAVGSPNAINRTIDVAPLSSWLAVRAIDRETRRLDSIENRIAPSAPVIPPPVAVPAPVDPPPAVSAAPAPPANSPAADVPVPNRDPRRSLPKPRATAVPSHPPAAPQAFNTPPSVAPLPAPVEIRPAPVPRSSRPRQPLVLTPPASGPSRPAL